VALEFTREQFHSADAAALVQAQEEEIRVRGDHGDVNPPDGSVFEPPEGVFLVLRDGGKAIGCAGFRRVDADRAELKRMYLAPEARGRGLGRVLLQRIEDEARSAGYTVLVLETIELMTEAIGLYRSSGYEPISPFGPYTDVGVSRCFEKRI
jgi:GNAT superfamily N-acetyltransferase